MSTQDNTDNINSTDNDKVSIVANDKNSDSNNSENYDTAATEGAVDDFNSLNLSVRTGNKAKQKNDNKKNNKSALALYRLFTVVSGVATLVVAICILMMTADVRKDLKEKNDSIAKTVATEDGTHNDKEDSANDTDSSEDLAVKEDSSNEDSNATTQVDVTDKKDDSEKGSITNPDKLTLSQIQEMDSLDIIDAFLISKTNARRNNYNHEDLVRDGDYWYYEVDDKKTTKLGVDVSSFQGEIDWDKVKESGVDFAIVRIGYRGYGTGKIVEDEYCKDNIKGAIEAGLDVGVYFFSQAINEDEAREEAEFVYDIIKKYDITLPVSFDSEDVADAGARTKKAKLTAKDRTKIALAFCEYIEDKGYESSIYSNMRWFLRSLDLEMLDESKIWLALYSTEPTFPFHYGMWQYTSTGEVDGIKGDVDMDIYFCDGEW